MKRSELSKQVGDLVDALLVICKLYGPVTAKKAKEILSLYYPAIDEKWDVNDIEASLKGLAKSGTLYKYNTKYSTIPFDVLKEIDEINPTYKKFKKENFKHFNNVSELKRAASSYCTYNPKVNELEEYLKTLSNDSKTIKQIIKTIIKSCDVSINSTNIEKGLDDVFPSIDISKTTKLIKGIYDYAPRPYLNGYSIHEFYADLIKKDEISDDVSLKEDPILKYPMKRKYGSFSYEQVLSLGRKLMDSNIFNIIDSERIIELTINSQKVYVSVLGKRGGDKGLFIFNNQKEFINSYAFLHEDPVYNPDLVHRLSLIQAYLDEIDNNIKISFQGKGVIASAPFFVRIEANTSPRLLNDEEINLVGAVLDELIKLIDFVSYDELVSKLGQYLDSESFLIDEVYVTYNEVLFGRYCLNEIGMHIPNFEVNDFNTELLNNYLNLPKMAEVQIGLYTMPFICDEQTSSMPYILILLDSKNDLILDVKIFEVKDADKMKDYILDILTNLGQSIQKLEVNNLYAFDVFSEFMFYVDNYDLVNDVNKINSIYKELMNIDKGSDSSSWS